MQAINIEIINQHLIDPEIRIRYNACEVTCAVVLALLDIAKRAGLNRDKVSARLNQQAQLHMETY